MQLTSKFEFKLLCAHLAHLVDIMVANTLTACGYDLLII